MKKVATAMGNPTLNQELKRYSQIDVMGDDLFYQEAVIDLLEKETIDVLALSGILQGQWDLCDFVDRIQKKNPIVRMIVILDENDTEIKCSLLERGIQDIFIDDAEAEVEVKAEAEAENEELKEEGK